MGLFSGILLGGFWIASNVAAWFHGRGVGKQILQVVPGPTTTNANEIRLTKKEP